MRFAFIESVRKAFPVSLLCSVMRVSSSGFYAWLTRGTPKRQREHERLLPLVRAIQKQTRHSYGSRRLSEELSAQGVPCGRHKGSTLMKLAGATVKRRKKFKVTTDSRHTLPISQNRLNREFQVETPNRVWCSDMTYV